MSFKGAQPTINKVKITEFILGWLKLPCLWQWIKFIDRCSLFTLELDHYKNIHYAYDCVHNIGPYI